MSFALLALYLFLILINFVCCSVEFCKTWNEGNIKTRQKISFKSNKFYNNLWLGLWCFKVTIVAAVFVLLFFVSNSILFVFVEITKYTSLIYLAFQSLVIIDLLYIWSQSWVKIFNEGNINMKYALIITSFILYALTLTLNILIFIWFKGCGLNSVIASVNLVITITIAAV